MTDVTQGAGQEPPQDPNNMQINVEVIVGPGNQEFHVSNGRTVQQVLCDRYVRDGLSYNFESGDVLMVAHSEDPGTFVKVAGDYVLRDGDKLEVVKRMGRKGRKARKAR